jgi:hypothetical protein
MNVERAPEVFNRCDADKKVRDSVPIAVAADRIPRGIE